MSAPPITIPQNAGTDWFLYELRFQAEVPQLATKSEAYLRVCGMPTSGNADVDRTLSNQWLSRWMNIDMMVELHRKGVPIKIVKNEDSLKIYQYIQNHLEAWAKHSTGGFNAFRVPKDDLIALDRLAEHVYPHARNHFKDTSPQSSFIRSLQESAVIMEAPREDLGEKEEAGKRQDFTEVFASIQSGGFQWK